MHRQTHTHIPATHTMMRLPCQSARRLLAFSVECRRLRITALCLDRTRILVSLRHRMRLRFPRTVQPLVHARHLHTVHSDLPCITVGLLLGTQHTLRQRTAILNTRRAFNACAKHVHPRSFVSVFKL